MVNRSGLVGRAEIIQAKGTNRRSFLRGEVDKYTWREVESSFLLGELPVSCLETQLNRGEEITKDRLVKWQYYHNAMKSLEAGGKIRRPKIPDHCQHNAHIYHLLLHSLRMVDEIHHGGTNKKVN